jgi:hypothetical protein
MDGVAQRRWSDDPTSLIMDSNLEAQLKSSVGSFGILKYE